MNKKGFTLVELIAVVVIIGIISLLAAPNIVNLMDSSKKSEFVSDAKEFISRAKYMEKLEKYNLGNEYFSIQDSDNKPYEKKILLRNIINISDYSSPYNSEYESDLSYVLITLEEKDGIQQKVAKIYLEDKNGYHIGSIENPVSESKLDKENVEEPEGT